MFLRLTACLALSTALLSAEVPDVTSLSGQYFFTETFIEAGSDWTGSLRGTLSFSGTGTFTFQGEGMSQMYAPSPSSGSGTYSVDSGGRFVLNSIRCNPESV